MIKRIYILSFLSLILFISAPVTSAYQFSNPMQVGSRGNDVAALQKFLVAKGYLVMPAGVSMGYFGELTKAAVTKFQRDNPSDTYLKANITQPNGVAGRYTLNKINQLEAINKVSPNSSANKSNTALSPEDINAIAPYLPPGVKGFMDSNGNVYASPAVPSSTSLAGKDAVQGPPQTLAENLPKFTGKIKQIIQCRNTTNALVEFDREWWQPMTSNQYGENEFRPDALVTRPGSLMGDGTVAQLGLPGTAGACVKGFFVPKKSDQQLCIFGDGTTPANISGTIFTVLGGLEACNPVEQLKSECFSPELTSYSPQAGGDSMEGGYASSKPGLDGKLLVRTLDDVRTGKSDYVTLAGDPSQYGKVFNIALITYRDNKGNYYNLYNVKAYVHDTGPAFRGDGNTHFDVAVTRDGDDATRNQFKINNAQVCETK